MTLPKYTTVLYVDYTKNPHALAITQVIRTDDPNEYPLGTFTGESAAAEAEAFIGRLNRAARGN